MRWLQSPFERLRKRGTRGPSVNTMAWEPSMDLIPTGFTRFRYAACGVVSTLKSEAELSLRQVAVDCIPRKRWESTTRVIGART